MARTRMPSPLRHYADGQAEIEVSGNTVEAALADLIVRYPDLRNHLYSGNVLRSFVNIYLNQEDIRHLDGANTALAENDRLLIVPSIAGG